MTVSVRWPTGVLTCSHTRSKAQWLPHTHSSEACEPSLAHRVRRERSRVGDQRSCNSRGELRIIPLRRARRASNARSPFPFDAVIAAAGVLHRGARLLRGPAARQAKPLHSARSPSRWRRSPSASGSGESRWVGSCSKRATHRWTSSRSTLGLAVREAECDG